MGHISHTAMRRGAAAVAGALMAAAGLGCGGPNVTSASPPTVVCGTTLDDSAAGAVLLDATRTHGTIRFPSGGLRYFRVSRLCSHGARVAWTPASAASLMKQARARDGLPAAVVLRLRIRTGRFTLTAKRGGAVVASTTLRLYP